MPFYGDYHTHSRYSDGRQDILDIVQAAEHKGLHEVAITEHGPLAAVIGVKNTDIYQDIHEQIDAINRSEVYAVQILLGAEANIRGLDGSIDLPEESIRNFDLLIAGLHPFTWPSSASDIGRLWIQNYLRYLGRSQREKAINANTKATVECLYTNQEVDILSHPGLFYEVDVEEVARACVKNNVLFEINCGHEHPDISDIMKADQVGVEFIVNSDAHFPESVGNLNYGLEIMNKCKISLDRINNWLE
ncbi:MAG: PHP domain-containing protein [Bacillota bacterium]|nr:PHP domain-containing protein [Bacillota bacterium]